MEEIKIFVILGVHFLCLRLDRATCPPGQGSAATPKAREGVKSWGNRPLYVTRLCVFAIFGTATSVGHLPK